jgi:hypothetical protein
MNTRPNALAFALLMLSACSTTPTTTAAGVIEADAQMVSGCKYLGEVHARSGWGNLAATTGITRAQNAVREKAAERGATHVVWGDISGGYVPNVSGHAYRCG